MRKIICIFFVILGAIIVGAGVFLQVGDMHRNSSISSDGSSKTSTGAIMQSKSFQRINNLNLEETCSTYKTEETFINTSDYTKISFTYPDCVHEYRLSFWYKLLSSEDENISIDIRTEKETLNNYMNENKTKVIADKEEAEYRNLTLSEVTYLKTENDMQAAMFEVNYQYKFITTQNYDTWYIAVQITEEMILTFKIESKEKIVSMDAVNELINNIKVEQDKAEFKNSKIDGSVQTGSIRLNKNKEYEHGYKLNYQVNRKYPEVDSFGSDYDESTFEFETITEKLYANILLEYDSFYETFDEKLAKNKKSALSMYEESENYKNTVDSGLIKKTINGKEVHYFIYKYDYFLPENKTKSYTGYYSNIYYQIAPDYYFKIYLSTKTIEINEAVISEFLNFTIEEY